METTAKLDPSKEQIGELAHELWEKEGRPEGQAEEHWRRAEEELRNRHPADVQTEHQNFL